ncbi:MAG: ABC transporter substrate-binding protein, partial [Vulcanimicrobiaceae bacterium]
MVVRWLSALACIVALAGCSKAGSLPPAHGNYLIVAYPDEPVSLNPLLLEGAVSYAVSELGYSYLTNYDSRGTIVPDVAARVPTVANGEISRDGMRVTYTLRRGVRWQDGAELTARDVAFTFRAILNPANSIPSRYGYDQVASVQTPDAYTVVVHLKHPYSPIVSYFFGGDSNYPILPAHLLSRFPDLNHVAFNASPVGSGPFVYTRWSRGDSIATKANAGYYAGRPPLDGIALRLVHDSSTAVAQLTTGEADAAFFADVTRIASLRAIPGHRVVITPVPYFYALLFN